MKCATSAKPPCSLERGQQRVRRPPRSAPRRSRRRHKNRRYHSRRPRSRWRRCKRGARSGLKWRPWQPTEAREHSSDSQWSDVIASARYEEGANTTDNVSTTSETLLLNKVHHQQLYGSDSALYNMPVSFENSAMKTCFSLSSLPPSSTSLETPEQAMHGSERPYNSLTKKPRRKPEQEAWRRSWGSREANKDEFWAALQSNYNYLMDNHLIDSCKEANGELAWDEQDVSKQLWSLEELMSQFSELCSWLNGILENVYGNERNVVDRNLRVGHMEELQRRAYRLKLFNEQSEKLVQQHPEAKDDISWKVAMLNRQWKRLEMAISPRRTKPDQIDVSYEIRCFKKWIREMEARLKPVDSRAGGDWGLQELEEKSKEYMILHLDVESHGRIINSIKKLCGRLKADGGDNKTEKSGEYSQVVRLERRWQCLYLIVLEWQCHLESLIARFRSGSSSPSGISSDSDEEPVFKYPRLSTDAAEQSTDDGSYFELTDKTETEKDDLDELSVMDTSPSSVPQTDEDCKMVGTTSPRPVVPSSPDVNDNYNCSAKASATPLTSFSKHLAHGNFSRFNELVHQNSPNIATFYFLHPDTDSEHDGAKAADPHSPQKSSVIEESSEEDEGWTYTPTPVTPAASNIQQDAKNASSRSPVSTDSNSDSSFQPRSSVAMRLNFDSPKGESNKSETGQKDSVTKRFLHSSKEEIQKLVIQAEELVREDATTTDKKSRNARVFPPLMFNTGEKASHAKYKRIKEWLRLHPEEAMKPQDSCDASGEYTTGDSEEDVESNTSEDQNGSIATCKQIDLLAGPGISSRSCSAEAFFDPEATPIVDSSGHLVSTTSPEHAKVTMRAKRGHSSTQQRPWSVSDASLSRVVPEMVAKFSISESALHQMESSTPRTALSSTTMEEGGASPEGSGSGSGRRRKIRTRKRTVGRKSESGGSGAGSSDSQQRKNKSSPMAVGKPVSTSYDITMKSVSRARTLVKSMSCFSVPSAMRVSPRLSSSAPVVPSLSTSGTTTEEEEQVRLPRFRLGYPVGGSSWKGEAASTGGATEEQLSLFSDQAWDPYQEKYLSEPYSEELDDSTRLLAFGDDYSNFLDSQSDCMSSLSTNNGTNGSPAIRRRRPIPAPISADYQLMDSDSDLEDVQHLFQQSLKQYKFAERVFMEQCASSKADLVLNSDFAELIATCRDNIQCLNILLENVRGDGGLLSAQERRKIRSLVEHWEDLRFKAEDKQRFRILERQICTLKDEIVTIASRVIRRENFRDQNHLKDKINVVEGELDNLRHVKEKMLDVNVNVHRFHVDGGNAVQTSAAATLKEQVTELYRTWDETFENVSDHLGNLQRLAFTWKQFDMDLSELLHFLRDDRDQLDRLSSTVMRNSSMSQEDADSIRKIAKTLIEKSRREQKSQPEQMDTNDDTGSMPSLSAGPASLTTEGSLSDSGISDSGSEQDLSDRERRLLAIRKLVRTLEASLEPGSVALMNILKRMKQAEADLERVKSKCNDLVRTRLPSEIELINSSKSSLESPNVIANGIHKPSSRKKKSRSGSPGDPDNGKSSSWKWRVFRCALSFNIALFTIICMACLMEPRCCEAINNLNFAFSPQLRYVRGPPPI